MKLSERVAAGENTQELREDVARALGWAHEMIWEDHRNGDIWEWFRGEERQRNRPDYLTDIRLTLADIEQRGWEFEGAKTKKSAWFLINAESDLELLLLAEVERPDRNLTLVALEALLRAVESE